MINNVLKNICEYCTGNPDELLCDCEYMPVRYSDDTNISELTESQLVIRAFVLDTKLNHPEEVIIADGDREVPFSEILNNDPGLRDKLIKERDIVFQLLGIEVSDEK